MGTNKKHSFYPKEEVARELSAVPKGHLSERVNELILKGLSAENQEQIAHAYRQYDSVLASAGIQDKHGPGERLMSAKAFGVDDEVDDFI